MNSRLKGKRIYFLGSSVTYGEAAQGTSFADFLQEKDGCISIKEAVSGTTLVDDNSDSYISRMKRHEEKNIDAFVCQLSTNDASQKKPLGQITADKTVEFDTHTICGAIEYIINYAKRQWDCPIFFYTNAFYEDENYQAMVDALYEIQKKYEITIIDLYRDENFNNISAREYQLYMADKIHPTKAGYLEWWLPKFEEVLEKGQYK